MHFIKITAAFLVWLKALHTFVSTHLLNLGKLDSVSQFAVFFLIVIFYLFIYLFIYLFLTALGLRFCARAFSSCGKRGPLIIAVRGPLTIAASLPAEHRLQTRRLSSCGSRAQLLRSMWDLPRPGLEPVSPALAGWFSTTAPPGKPLQFLKREKYCEIMYSLTAYRSTLDF